MNANTYAMLLRKRNAMENIVNVHIKITSTSNSDFMTEVITDMKKNLQTPLESNTPTPEQIEKFDEVRNEYMTKLENLREEYHTKFVAILQEDSSHELAGHAN